MSIKVLIVDDEPGSITRAKHLIKSFPDIEVIGEATRADDAQKKILRLNPDVVLIDVELGPVTCFEVISRLEQQGCRSKFIVVTAYDHYTIPAIRSRVYDYLLKPINLAELGAALERVRETGQLHYRHGNAEMMNLLTAREKTVLDHILNGRTSQEIADLMQLSRNTIDTYRRRILRKVGARDTRELIIRQARLQSQR